MSELKPKGKMGGKRPGAGSKPNYLKRLGVTPVNAAQITWRDTGPGHSAFRKRKVGNENED